MTEEQIAELQYLYECRDFEMYQSLLAEWTEN